MADPVPELALGLSAEARPIVLLEAGEAEDMADLLRLAPALAAPEHAPMLARIANHLAQAGEYTVIEDPAAFAAAYRARLAEEDPSEEWEEGVIRLSDFGVPNFEEITPPVLKGERLVFYAVHAFLGVPYKAETANLTATPSYEPLPLTPVD
jgi:hypothetical protein